MTTILLGIALMTGYQAPSYVEARTLADGTMTMHYRNQGSVKAHNKWDVLNLSPRGVVPGVVVIPKGRL